ncbi:MAG: hypothetical protein HYW57_03995 [Ignavibacteriales bacterium]|nr:hypothetical protein [Ignavibacteriales bacterium]
MKENTFQRAVSEDEARQGYVFVLKDALGFFPVVGRQFEIQQGESVRKIALEARSCQCRGPDKPHAHYFFRWNSLHRGDTVVVKRDPKKAHRYHLQIRSARAQREFCG